METLKYLIFCLLLQLVSAGNSHSCAEACAELAKTCLNGSVKAAPESNAYWATNVQNIQGACYVYPRDPQQVAEVLRTAQKYDCQFAVKGGGHSDVPGASNIDNGLVLMLDKFDKVEMSNDKTYVKVGAGNYWGAVYKKLDTLNYTVIGGRETTVGVAGLTLGGGISFFSGTYGFACDNVLAYEVVLANGSITTVSEENEPDLYRALRGGGNNFAVVTQFHLAAHEYDLIQGGFEIYSDSPATQEGFISAFDYFAKNGPESPDANMYITLSYSNNTPLWISGLSYSKPTPPIPAVPAYKLFYTKSLNESKIASTRRVGTHGDFATELGLTQPSGLYEQFHTGTYVSNISLLHDIYDHYRQVVARIQKTLAGTNESFTPSLAFLAVTENILETQSQRGGNVLGLKPGKRPLMIMSMSWPWANAKYESLISGGMDDVMDYADKISKQRGLFNPFIYMNYASTGQQVIEGYGRENVEFMKKVSAKYDPEGVFQKLVPGGFKLPKDHM